MGPADEAGGLVQLLHDPVAQVLWLPHFLPEPFGIGVVRVDPLDPDMPGPWGTEQADVNVFPLDRMPRQGMVGEQDGRRFSSSYNPGIHRLVEPIDEQLLGAEIMEQAKGPIGGLGDTVESEQAKPSLKRD